MEEAMGVSLEKPDNSEVSFTLKGGINFVNNKKSAEIKQIMGRSFDMEGPDYNSFIDNCYYPPNAMFGSEYNLTITIKKSGSYKLVAMDGTIPPNNGMPCVAYTFEDGTMSYTIIVTVASPLIRALKIGDNIDINLKVTEQRKDMGNYNSLGDAIDSFANDFENFPPDEEIDGINLDDNAIIEGFLDMADPCNEVPPAGCMKSRWTSSTAL
jgi:hypothetical protein